MAGDGSDGTAEETKTEVTGDGSEGDERSWGRTGGQPEWATRRCNCCVGSADDVIVVGTPQTASSGKELHRGLERLWMFPTDGNQPQHLVGGPPGHREMTKLQAWNSRRQVFPHRSPGISRPGRSTVRTRSCGQPDPGRCGRPRDPRWIVRKGRTRCAARSPLKQAIRPNRRPTRPRPGSGP